MATRYLFTIAAEHVGRGNVKLADRNVYLAGCFGLVQQRDIGKRVFDVNGVIQVENDEQRDARIARNLPEVTITAVGGTAFDVHRNGEFLGRTEFGSLDEDDQYVESDDEIIEYFRQYLGLDKSITVSVRN